MLGSMKQYQMNFLKKYPTGHVDGSSAITGKASTYQNVLFQPKPEQYQPRFFRRYKSCTDGGGLDVKGYFIEFDLNRDGRVSVSIQGISYQIATVPV